MPQFLLDTDHLTLLEFGQPLVLQRWLHYLPNGVGVSAVTVEEALRGRLGLLSQASDGRTRIQRYQYLLGTVGLLQQLTLVVFDQPSEDRFQLLRQRKLRIGIQDQKIAAVALANRLVLVTRNRRDFAQDPGLVLDDWSV